MEPYKRLSNLKAMGVNLHPSHPCRQYGGCSISVDYDPRLMKTVIKHRLGDKLARKEVDNVMRQEVNLQWPDLIIKSLGQMHMTDSGIYRDGDAYSVITPYISQEDAIEMASEIYTHTGARVTIPH